MDELYTLCVSNTKLRESPIMSIKYRCSCIEHDGDQPHSDRNLIVVESSLDSGTVFLNCEDLTFIDHASIEISKSNLLELALVLIKIAQKG